MGAWGPAIFSDDLACDVRGEYRELLEDGVPDDEATRRVIQSFAYLTEDDAHTLWLALEALRQLSLDADADLVETLHWNNPVYLDGSVRMWMLQAFGKHCSLRFPTRWFAQHKDEVTEAGYASGAGFVKLPYDRELPTELLAGLIQAGIDELEATGPEW